MGGCQFWITGPHVCIWFPGHLTTDCVELPAKQPCSLSLSVSLSLSFSPPPLFQRALAMTPLLCPCLELPKPQPSKPRVLHTCPRTRQKEDGRDLKPEPAVTESEQAPSCAQHTGDCLCLVNLKHGKPFKHDVHKFESAVIGPHLMHPSSHHPHCHHLSWLSSGWLFRL